MKLFSLLTLMLLLGLQTGCATYGNGIQQALTSIDQGNFEQAASQIESALSAQGNDRLLYHLELGVIRHLEGDYAESNRLLENAARISESLKEASFSQSLVTLMSNPRNSPYAGNTHEEMMIYYYKALNYLAIAGALPAGNSRLDAIEGARVEARRLLLRLQALRNNEGSYQDASSREQSTFAKTLNVFSVLMGNLIDTDALTYRDDALAHYLTGVSFEMNREYDNARISYRKAAESYEQGYAEQFRLGSDMAAQAWLDCARMQYLSGATLAEIQQDLNDKLPANAMDQIRAQIDQAQVLVIEHKGRVPEKREMNLSLAINPALRALELKPYFFEYSQEELNWFYLLYADKMAFGVVADYLNATRNHRVDLFTKTVFLGPLYDTAESFGLTSAVGSSLRVTVPYYAQPEVYGRSHLKVNGDSLPLARAASPQQMAIQEQMKNAGPEIRAALARSAVKALTASQLGSQDSSGLLALAGKLAAQLTDAAETRSWLLLPAEVHIRRLFLDPGNYTLTLDSTLESGKRQQHQRTLNVAPGDIRLWTVRSTGGSTTAPPVTNDSDTDMTPDGEPNGQKPLRRSLNKD